MSQWLCNMRVLYWKGLRSVLSSNTVHLLSHQYMEIIVPPAFGFGETGTRQIKVCWRRADLSRGLSLALVCLLCSYLLGKLVAYATLCSCMIWWQQQRPRNPGFFFSSFSSCSITPLLLFRSNSSAHLCASPSSPPPLLRLQTTSCLCWGIDPPLLRQQCHPLSALVWNWIAEPLVLSGRDVIWDSGNRMLWCQRQLLQDTEGSQTTLDSRSSSLQDCKCSQ